MPTASLQYADGGLPGAAWHAHAPVCAVLCIAAKTATTPIESDNRLQLEALQKAAKEQSKVVYNAWRQTAYNRLQNLATRAGSLADFTRFTLKQAHFLELSQQWCAYGEMATSV